MASVFTPRTNTVVRVVAAALLVTPMLGVGVVMLLARSPLYQKQFWPLVQPVEFDHRHHVGDEAIDCRYCHTSADQSASAGYPAVELCMNCHAQIWNQSPILAPVRERYFRNRSIPWQRVHNLPDFVFFHHGAHVRKGVGCVTCHGRVDQMASVQKVHALTMSWCIDCHRDPTPHLRPREAVTSMTWVPTEGSREELAREYDVRPRTSCTACHR